VNGVGDQLTVSAGTVTFNGAAQLAPTVLTLSGGTLNGSESFFVAGLVWSGGAMSGSGTTDAFSIYFNGGAATLGRELENQGLALMTGSNSYLTLLAGAVFNNLDSTEFEIANNQGVFGSGTFNNQANGFVVRTGDTGTATIQPVFNNNGTVLVQTGMLYLSGGGSHSGSFSGSTGTTLQFGAGSVAQSFQNPSTLAGSNVVFSSGSATINGTYNITESSTFNGATVTFTSAATLTSIGSSLSVSAGSVTFSRGEALHLTNLAISGGTVTGSDDIMVSGNFNWNGGTLSGAGTITANGFCYLEGTTTLGRTFNNAGLAYLQGPSSYLTLQTGAVWNNVPTSGLVLVSTQGIFGTGTVNINSSSALSVLGTATIQATLINTGSVFLNDATLVLSGQGDDTSGVFSTDTTGTLQFAGGSHDFQATAGILLTNVVFGSGSVNLNGAYRVSGSTIVSGATVTFNAGMTVMSIGASLTVSGGAVTFSTGTAITPATLLVSGGNLSGSDNVTVSGLFTWWGGTMSGTGTTTANGGLTIDGSGLTLARPLTNTATATWTGLGDITATTDGVVNNQANAVIDVQNNQTLSGPSCIPIFNNAGIFRKEAAFGVTTVALFFNNTGSEDIQTGTVNFVCGGGSPEKGEGAAGYPAAGSVAVTGVLHTNGSAGAITMDAQSPTGDGVEAASVAPACPLADPFFVNTQVETDDRDAFDRYPRTPAPAEAEGDGLMINWP
jgi:hypothetical protein